MGDSILEVNNIEVVYNDVILVLKGISLEVKEEGVVALLGGNGAGKSTTLKAITGLLKVQNGKIKDGTVKFMGEETTGKDADEITSLGISLVPEGRQVFDDLSVYENLLIGAHRRKDRKAVKRDIEKILDYFPNLKDRLEQRALLLSGGEQQMLVIGRAFMANPKLLLLDEPSLGLSPLLVREIFAILKNLTSENKTSVLLVEQNARIALNFAQYGYIMENGKVVLDGPVDRLKENKDVKEFYLGVTMDDKKKSYSEVKHYKRRKRWLS